MVRLWGRDDRFALKDAAIAAAMDRSLHVEGQARSPFAPGPIEIGVDVDVSPSEALVWFCDPQRWTRFQGRQAWLDPRPGGRLRLDLGDDVYILGHYVEVSNDRVVFTWGREGDPVMPPESTEVTVSVVPRPGGCAVILRHDGLPDEDQVTLHRSGWRYHLLRLAVAASGATGDTEVVDLFLAAFGESDAPTRRGLVQRTCIDSIAFADELAEVFGVTQVIVHLGRYAETGSRRVRRGDVERIGSLLRCDFDVRSIDADDSVPSQNRGQLVASIDSGHLSAASLFPVHGSTGAPPGGGLSAALGRAGRPQRSW